jgi:hypothetical protein
MTCAPTVGWLKRRFAPRSRISGLRDRAYVASYARAKVFAGQPLRAPCSPSIERLNGTVSQKLHGAFQEMYLMRPRFDRPSSPILAVFRHATPSARLEKRL